MEPDKAKELLEKALIDSSELIMKEFGRIQPYQQKESNASIVTQVDLDSEKLITRIIGSRFPGHNIIAEETGFKNLHSEYTWIIDPIDGTSNFAVGLPWFGVLICLMKSFEPIISGACLPYYQKFYFAEKDKGATCNNNIIQCSTETDPGRVLMSYSLDYSNNEDKLQSEMNILQKIVRSSRNLRSTNSLIDLCYTAEGRFGACMNQTCKIWDIASPYLILKESGAKITQFNGQKIDFRFDDSSYLRNFDYLASNPVLHQFLSTQINQSDSPII